MPDAAISSPPVLREGDRLTASEFLRRWEAMPDLRHAELLDGTVHMPSPVAYDHGSAVKAFLFWLSTYEIATPGCSAATDVTWVLGPRDVPQPDATLVLLPEYGGQSDPLAKPYATGAPELVLEVSGSTLRRDRGVKGELYRRAGVREYIVASIADAQLSWLESSEGAWREITPATDGYLKSRVFPGLWLPAGADWHLPQLKNAVEAGLSSPEHATFLKALAEKAANRG